MASNDRDDWLKNYIHSKIDTALNDEDGDVSEVRQNSFDRYYGKPYGNEREGKSRFITREVLESVEWAMPSVLRVFTTNQQAVEFIADSEADEEQAQQETDIVNHVLQVDNNGYLVLHNWLKDILMYPNGYVACYPDEVKNVTEDTITGLTAEGFQRMEADKEVEILEAEAYLEEIPGLGAQQLFKAKAKYSRMEVRTKVESIAPDEVLVDDQWTSVDLEDCPFVAVRRRRSVSDLVEEGYDYDDLQALGDVDENTFSAERTTRLFYEEESPDADDEGEQDGAAKMLWVHYISIKADYDDDGIAERRRIVLIGDEIFENEIDDYQPIVSCSAIIMQHKHIGMSYVEIVEDLQKIATTISRQMLDNIYAHTDRRHFFNESALIDETLDDYLDGRSSAIMVRGNPAEAVMPEINAPITQELLAVKENIKQQTSLRTGVAPELSLDPNTLKQSTEGAFANALDQANQRLEMLVRNIAEVGYKPLMRKIQTCLRLHSNTPGQVKIRGTWVNFDPSEWKDRTKMQVNVGLGHNNREQEIQLLMGLLDLQKEALGQNLADQSKIYTTLTRLVEAAGVGAATSYFTDPKEPGWQPPQPPPDPQTELFAAQAKALGDEQQRKAQEAQAKFQAEMQKMQLDMQKMQMDMEQAQASLDMDRAKFDLEREKFDAQFALDSTANVAQLRETNANAELKKAQEALAYSNAGQAEAGARNAEAQARKTDTEASEEMQEARDIVQNGLNGRGPEDESETRP